MSAITSHDLQQRNVFQGDGHPSLQRIRPWRVLHATHDLRPLLGVLESQASVGMKPSVVTPSGVAQPEDFLKNSRSKPASLLSAWNDVRVWRRCLLEAEASAHPRGFELVHPHCFAAGMAAVRNCPAVVYEIHNFVEEQSQSAGPKPELSWLRRSFRVAEQFVITRAGAVVVHSSSVRQGVLERGAAPENLFEIPSPLEPELLQKLELAAWQKNNHEFNLFAPGSSERPLSLDWIELLLESVARLRVDGVTAHLFLPSGEQEAAALLERAKALGVADAVHAIRNGERERAFALADVVLYDQSDAGQDADGDSVLIHGLANGAIILAAESSGQHSIEAGVVRFAHDDVRDLARRAAFLAANPELRHSMVQAGRKHLAHTRNPEAIGRLYDRAYQRAWLRRRIGGPGTLTGSSLEPLRQTG